MKLKKKRDQKGKTLNYRDQIVIFYTKVKKGLHLFGCVNVDPCCFNF